MDARRVGVRLFRGRHRMRDRPERNIARPRSFKRTRLCEGAPHHGPAHARGASSGMWNNGAARGAPHSICGLSRRDMPSARRRGPGLTSKRHHAAHTVTGYTACVTARDVLMSRVHDDDGLGLPMYALSSRAHGRREELWSVTAEGQTSQTLHSFAEALDVALTWAVESGGEIYRRDRLGAEPGLYKAAW